MWHELCIETDEKLIACQMTVDLLGWHKNEFIPELSEWVGTANDLTTAQGTDIILIV
jgi:peroxiredoxin family protein